ncbi:MAG: hypothetical protein ACW98X_04175 [Promethearchaeota archaeon]|jgi:hypothetical protein
MTISKKTTYKIVILTSVFLGFIGVLLLFLLNSSLVVNALVNVEGMIQATLIILVRIIILSITTYYLLNKWFKQEAQYLSDIPFLLSLFFLILTFGKAIDLFWDMTFNILSEGIVLLLLKIRYITIVLEVAPLIYLGLEILFFRLEDRFQKLKNKTHRDKLRIRLISLMVIIELVVIIMTPGYNTLALLLPVIVIPSLLGIVYIFFLAYRLNRLTVVKPKFLTIGFFLYLISNILRPVMQRVLGDNASYISVVELIDIFVFLVIFLGLYKKKSVVKGLISSKETIVNPKTI